MGKSTQDEMLVTTPNPNFFNDIFVEVRKMALDLLATHNLHDWLFAFNGRSGLGTEIVALNWAN